MPDPPSVRHATSALAAPWPAWPHRRLRRHGHLGKCLVARRSRVIARIMSVTTPPAKTTQGAMTRRSESVTLPPGDTCRRWRPVSRAAQSQLMGSLQCTLVCGMFGEACVVVVWSRDSPGDVALCARSSGQYRGEEEAGSGDDYLAGRG